MAAADAGRGNGRHAPATPLQRRRGRALGTAPAGKEGAFFDEAVERGPRDAEFKHRCYPKARDLAAFFLFRPEAPTFFFLGALGFRLGGS